jgi:septum formation protein
MVLLERIEGDFYTVMGLPVSRVWQRLQELGYFGKI